MSSTHNVPTAVLASSSLVRQGLTSILRETRFQILPTAPASSEPADLADIQPRPTLVLAVIEDEASLQVTRALSTALPEAKLVLIGLRHTSKTLPKDLCWAAHGLLNSDIEGEKLITALDLIMSGVSVQGPGLFSWLHDQ